MANRRTPPKNTVSTQNLRDSTSVRHKYRLRHSPLSRKRDLPDSHDTECSFNRPVLVPLHPNLRRLPSRLMVKLRLRDKPSNGADREDYSLVGGKRKRVASENENTYNISGRGIRGPARFKKRRAVADKDDTSDDDLVSSSAMDVDVESDMHWDLSEQSDAEVPEDDSDDFLLYEASASRLQRLRKDELIRLGSLAGLHNLTEALKKSEIIDSIIFAREENVEVPPSSPPGPSDSHSSEYSSDDGHEGGGEETDATLANTRFSLRRRVTVQSFQQIGGKLTNGRSLSLGEVDASNDTFQNKGKKIARISAEVGSPVHNYSNSLARRRVGRDLSSLSSPLRSGKTISSPPATRLRSRTVSRDISEMSTVGTPYIFETVRGPSRSSSMSTASARKGKAKQVDFDDSADEFLREDVSVSPTPTQKGRHTSKNTRSSKSISKPISSDADVRKRRITPMRKAKDKVGCLKEESTEEEAEDVGSEDEGEGEKEQDEDVDQLPDSSSASRRTPVRRRLRPRQRQTCEAPSDGDDEEDDEDEDVSTSEVIEAIEDNSDDNQEASSEDDGSTDTEDQEDQLMMTPRKLRNGKIVGEDIAVNNESEPESTSDQEIDEIDSDQLSVTGSETSIEQDTEAIEDADEDADEAMEDDIDLNAATQKSLIRLRRDDLVRLCEAREIETEGTKAELAEALLKWRDREEDSNSAPSSSSTVRPPSTSKSDSRTNGHARRSKSSTTPPAEPVLLRSHRIHLDEPRTPPISGERKDVDADLELDLESLGLEDREIPPDKLVKLEKIGSGGFKDVFIGKFKGRKVAIAEFRDQLSSMDIKELKLLAEFQHPNIVRFLGVSIPENPKETPVMIVSELCTNGDLFDYVRNVSPPSLYRVLCIMLDIARGLQYLHERKPSVIHRDCKSSNILITSKGVAKIADFGLAKVKQSTRSMVRSLVGTVNWQAPELWHPHPKYNHKVDVYSCGSVYWEILQWHNPCKKFPWEGMNEHAIYEAVGTKKQRPPVNGLRKQWCPEIVNLIEKMWAQDPQDRPAISEVVEELQEIVQIHR